MKLEIWHGGELADVLWAFVPNGNAEFGGTRAAYAARMISDESKLMLPHAHIEIESVKVSDYADHS